MQNNLVVYRIRTLKSVVASKCKPTSVMKVAEIASIWYTYLDSMDIFSAGDMGKNGRKGVFL